MRYTQGGISGGNMTGGCDRRVHNFLSTKVFLGGSRNPPHICLGLYKNLYFFGFQSMFASVRHYDEQRVNKCGAAEMM